MFPNQGGGIGLALDAQEEKRLGRMDGESFKVGVDAVAGDVINADEPSLFGIHEGKLAKSFFKRWMAQGHVISHGAEFAGLGKRQGPFVSGQDIAAKQKATVLLAVGLFQHLAFTATAGTFVRNNNLVVVGGDDLNGRTVHGHPMFRFANREQHAIDSFFRAGSGIEVVAEKFVGGFETVMDDDLFACEMSVSERRGDVDDGLGEEIIGEIFAGNDPLEESEAEGEESGVIGGDDHGVGPLPFNSGVEGEDGERLRLEPGEGFFPEGIKGFAVTGNVGRFVGGALITDHHAIRVPAAHVGFEVIGADPIAGAADASFLNKATSGNLIADFLPTIDGVARGKVNQIRRGACEGDGGSGFEDFSHFTGHVKGDF